MQIDRRVAVAASLGAMLSVQGGAAFAKHLFPLVGPDAASLLRIGLAALILLLVFRPRLRAFDRTQWVRVGLYGLALAVMNVTFFHALRPVQLVAMACVVVASVGSTLTATTRTT